MNINQSYANFFIDGIGPYLSPELMYPNNPQRHSSPGLPQLCPPTTTSRINLSVKPDSHNSVAAFERISEFPNQSRHESTRISSDNRIL